jgi:hypothetical protein
VKRGAIEIQIDELVLHGFAPPERHAIAEAIQDELTELLETRGLPGNAIMSREAVRTSPARLPPSPRAHQTGTAIAHAIYGVLKA